VTVDKERCKGCGLCVAACPQKVLEMSREINSKGYFFARPAVQPHCIGCRICGLSCPDLAIEVAVNGTRYNFFDY
jgi:2-oxoglutarate ferredoxin oxidoreductase subunit delta